MSESALALPAAVTMSLAAAVAADIDAAAQRSTGTLHIDASALADFDTSAIALLLHAQRVARSRTLALRVDGVPTKLRELAQLYGVAELLPLDGDGATT